MLMIRFRLLAIAYLIAVTELSVFAAAKRVDETLAREGDRVAIAACHLEVNACVCATREKKDTMLREGNGR